MALSVARGQLTDEDATAILCLGENGETPREVPRRDDFGGISGDFMVSSGNFMVISCDEMVVYRGSMHMKW